VWFRVYLYVTANPAATIRLGGFTSAGATASLLQLNASGQLIGTDGSSAAQATIASAIPLNQWFRVEGYVIGSASAGQVEIRRYDSPDAAVGSYSAIATSGAAINTTGLVNTYTWGCSSSLANYGPIWFDDMGLSDGGYMGPTGAVAAAPPDVPRITRPPGFLSPMSFRRKPWAPEVPPPVPAPATVIGTNTVLGATTVTTATTAGNGLIAVLCCTSATGPVSSVADSKGNAWSLVNTYSTGSYDVEVWAALGATTALTTSDTITPTWATTPTAPRQCYLTIPGVTSVDVPGQAEANGSSTSPS
jgi:hypothetical protein